MLGRSQTPLSLLPSMAGHLLQCKSLGCGNLHLSSLFERSQLVQHLPVYVGQAIYEALRKVSQERE